MAARGQGFNPLTSSRHNASSAHPQRRCQQSANMTRLDPAHRREGGGRMSTARGLFIFILIFILIPWG
jgi:hypothetical protein